MHVAVLHEHEDIVDYLASNFRQTLRVGDNVSAIMTKKNVIF